MPPRQPHPVRPSAARGTRCLAKGWPARGVGDERTGFRNSATPAAELGTRGGGLGGELSPLGSATRDARFSALVPHARWRNLWPAKGVNNSDRLAETYTEPYTVGPL